MGNECLAEDAIINDKIVSKFKEQLEETRDWRPIPIVMELTRLELVEAGNLESQFS